MVTHDAAVINRAIWEEIEPPLTSRPFYFCGGGIESEMQLDYDP